MNEAADTVPQAWFAVLCKPRAEAIARTHLQRQQFTCLLPMVRQLRRGVRGMQQQIEPLFPRYLFIETDADGRTLAPVRSTRGVSGLVRFGERAARVPGSVIATLRARLQEDGTIGLSVPAFVPGQSVRVTQGPFAGIHAIFESNSGAERVRLLMAVMGERVSVVVPRSHLVSGLGLAPA